MILGIDASNLRGGGGVTHLTELLKAANPVQHGFQKVIVWGGKKILLEIENRVWLSKIHDPLLDQGLCYRIFWQRFKLKKQARAAGCDVLFLPGGSDASGFCPLITMSQNLLPFEWSELKRFGYSGMRLKLWLLRITQSRTFSKAGGLIFLTKYAQDVVIHSVKKKSGKITIIPHGIDSRFFCAPRKFFDTDHYSSSQPFQILYVSKIDVYKHQWHVVEAVAHLREEGFPVTLNLVGPAYPPALKRLKKTMKKLDPVGEFISYLGSVPHQELEKKYIGADLFLFASSCENMPNILLEAMAAGLPIACSNRGPMPEVLGDGGIYFDPENVLDIEKKLRELILSAKLRKQLAKISFERAKRYTWERCAHETFEFMASTLTA